MKKITALFRQYLSHEQGNFAMTSAIGSMMLMILTGAAIDLQNMHSTKTEIQDLMDNSTFAAALSLTNTEEVNGSSETLLYQEVGKQFFNGNGRFNIDNIKSLEFTAIPNSNEVTGYVTLEQALLFGGLLGSKSKNISATATVALSAETRAKGCIIILDEDAIGLELKNGAHVDAPDCNISVHSTNNPAVTISNFDHLEVKELCVAGEHVTNTSGKDVASLETQCNVMENPFAGQFPEPDYTCTFMDQNYDDAIVTLNPGVYCGWHNFTHSSPQVTLNPGTYVINGAWVMDGGHYVGDGVTFYYANKESRLFFNGGVSGSITAPTTGDYAGVAMLEPDGLESGHHTLNDSPNFYVTGLVYLPSRRVSFNSGDDLTVRDTSYIVNRFTVNNGSELVLSGNTILAGAGGAASTPYLAN